jgi:hypothetical protein
MPTGICVPRLGPAADDGRGAVVFEAEHGRRGRAELLGEFLRDRREDLPGRRSPRDERCHPPQRGLLLRQRGLFLR